jgi:hypothetical protein
MTTRSLLALLLLLIAAPGRATVFGDAIQVNILKENVQENLNLTAQLVQLRSALSVARENLAFVRSVYGGINDLVHLNAEQELRDARDYFIAHQSGVPDALGLADDIARHGVRGTFQAWPLNQQVDAFRTSKDCDDYARRVREVCTSGARAMAPLPPPGCEWLQCSPRRQSGEAGTTELAGPSPYNQDAARRLAISMDEAVASPEARRQLLARAPQPVESEGLWIQGLLKTDPTIADGLLRQRAAARKNATTAALIYQDSLEAQTNSAKSQKLTAQASAISAQELAAVREIEAHRLAREQARDTDQALRDAEERRRLSSQSYYLGSLLYRALAGQPDPHPGPPAPYSGPSAGGSYSN